MIENEDVVAAGEVVALRRAKRIAADKAVAAARKFFGARFEGWEVWEAADAEVIVRAWDDAGDYKFFNAPVNNKLKGPL